MFDLNIHERIQKNDLLIAEPFLADPNFGRSVIFMCEHHEEGSFGLILNRPTEMMLSEVMDWLGYDFPLYTGGPVEQQALYFIHQIEDIEGSMPLTEGYFLGGSFEELKQRNLSGELTPENCRFFAGYSGWGKQQLEGEIKEHSWIIARVSLSKALQASDEVMWRDVLRDMGGRYRVFSNYPDDPQLN